MDRRNMIWIFKGGKKRAVFAESYVCFLQAHEQYWGHVPQAGWESTAQTTAMPALRAVLAVCQSTWELPNESQHGWQGNSRFKHEYWSARVYVPSPGAPNKQLRQREAMPSSGLHPVLQKMDRMLLFSGLNFHPRCWYSSHGPKTTSSTCKFD